MKSTFHVISSTFLCSLDKFPYLEKARGAFQV